MDINVQVNGQRLFIPTNLKSYAPGSQQFVRFIFDLSSDWDDLTVFAQFTQEENSYNQYLDEDNAVYLPHEITTGQCTMMLYGTGGSGDNAVIATTNYLVLSVREDRFIGDAESTDISESLYTQLVNRVNNMEASIPAAIDAAVPQYVTAWLEENITQPTTPVVDTSLSVSGAAADAKATGDAINAKTGLSNEAKQALLACFENVAWINEDGQDYVDALEAALYPPANLVSISAVYTQSGTVYDTDTLDSLKADLVVTATYDDSTTQTVTAYTLSGTLTEGTSTITVSYGGKTTTFDVTVTEWLSSISVVFSQGQNAIYTTDSLDVVKDYLTVTANYGDGTSAVVTDYTLSGALAPGTSTITATYGGKTGTFDVVVTAWDIDWEYTMGSPTNNGFISPVTSGNIAGTMTADGFKMQGQGSNTDCTLAHSPDVSYSKGVIEVVLTVDTMGTIYQGFCIFSPGMRLRIYGDKLRFNGSSTNNEASQSTIADMQANTDYVIRWEYDKANFAKVYLDGELVHTQSSTLAASPTRLILNSTQDSATVTIKAIRCKEVA